MHQSLIQIKPIPFTINNLSFHWIFLSSSNGAKMLFDNFNPNENVKIAAVGHATAQAISEYGHIAQFVGKTGDMKVVGNQFRKVINDGIVLFAGAEGGSRIISSYLPEKQTQFVTTYRTEIRKNIEVPTTEIAFLTSPSNAKAYLSRVVEPSQIIIAIGNTTEAYLKSEGIEDIQVPKSPQEEDVINLIERL